MNTAATEVKNVYMPWSNPKDSSGVSWLTFKYGEADKDPWKWPKVLDYQGKFYMWMSWNSDDHNINYKSIPVSQLATKSNKKEKKI